MRQLAFYGCDKLVHNVRACFVLRLLEYKSRPLFCRSNCSRPHSPSLFPSSPRYTTYTPRRRSCTGRRSALLCSCLVHFRQRHGRYFCYSKDFAWMCYCPLDPSLDPGSVNCLLSNSLKDMSCDSCTKCMRVLC